MFVCCTPRTTRRRVSSGVHVYLRVLQKVERLAASLHFIGAQPARGKRTVFVGDGYAHRCNQHASCFSAKTGFCSTHLLLLLALMLGAFVEFREEALAVIPNGDAGPASASVRGPRPAASDDDSEDAPDGDEPQEPHLPTSARRCVAARLCGACYGGRSSLRAVRCALAPLLQLCSVTFGPAHAHSAHRELQQRRERAAKLKALSQEMMMAKAAMGKGQKRKLGAHVGEAQGAPARYKWKTVRTK